jgi:tetratricopeptide (TPR) repeat protein
MWDADPANTALAIERHDALVDSHVRAHRGTLLKNKGEGDSTLSVFHTAPDAVNAAEAVMRALDAEAWPGGRPMRVRAAVHTGEAYERDGDYFGPTLNRAARVRSLARGGQILLTRAAAELVVDQLPGDCSLVDHGRHELRGISNVERVFELVATERAAAPAAPEGELPSALQATSPFVGRVDELARLTHAWERVRRGERRVALISGEPGIGKTRLTAQLASAVAPEGLVLFGRCEEGLSAPYQPFIEGIAGWLATVDDATLTKIAPSVLSDAARFWPAIAARVPGLPLAPSRDVDQDRYASFQATVELLAVVSAQHPVLFVLDDLQWATTPTVLLLRHVVKAEAALRVLFVCTFRDSEVEASHPFAAALDDFHRGRNADVFALTGLRADEIRELVAVSGAEAALTQHLEAETAGNPFFLSELLAAPGLPVGVRDVVAHRLGRLSENVQRILGVAAVLGAEFDHVDLAACVARDDRLEVVDAIEAAVGAGVLVESGRRHAFKHALVRQCVLDGLSSLRRASLHERVGEVIAARPNADARTAELAMHFAAAGNQPARAARYAYATAMRSLNIGAIEDARQSLDLMRAQLAQLDGTEPALRVDLDLADAYLLRAANLRGGKELALRIVRAAMELRDFDRAAEGSLLLVEAMGFSGDSDPEVVAVLRDAVEQTEGFAARAQLLGSLAQAIERSDGHPRAVEMSAEAVELARRSGSDDALFTALYAAWVTALCDGTMDERMAYSREMRDIAERTRADPLYNTAVLFHGIDGIESGDRAAFEAASEELWRNRESASKWMHDMTVRSYPWRSAYLALLDGRGDDAAANSDLMLGEAEVDPHPDLFAAYAGQVLLRGRELGQHEQFLPLLEDAIATSPELGAYQACKAMLLAELGRVDEARSVLDAELGGGVAGVNLDQETPATFAMVAEVAATLGDAGLARELRDRLEFYAGRLITVHSAVCVVGAADRFRAMLAHVVGDHDAAGAAFTRAIALEESAGGRPLAARSRLWYARHLRDVGNADEAAAVAAQGLATAEDLGMPMLADQLRALLT